MTEDQVATIVAAIDGASVLELAGIISVASSRLDVLQASASPAPMRSALALPIKPRASRSDTVRIYAAGAPGLLTLCHALGRTPVHKIGTTGQADLSLRIGELSRDHYGAFDQSRGVVRAGFGAYVQIPFVLASGQDLPPGIRHAHGCFEVDLAGAMTHGAFEAAFQRAMRPHGLADWAVSPQGRAQLTASGLTEADLPLATRLAGRTVRADEFYVIQPRKQADHVIAAITAALQSASCSSGNAEASRP
jgi:hypothetical protein